MLRFLVCVGIVGTLGLAGCGQTIDATPDGGVDAGPPPTNLLVIEGEGGLTLVFGEEATIGVRYLDPDRVPLVGQLVSFVLEGRAHDSSLRAVDVITNETGFASTTLMAGTTPAAFRVRVTADNADPAFVDIAVSDEGFGQLSVEVSHEGERDIDVLGVAVFAGLTCDDPETRTTRGDRFRLRPEDGPAVFLGLPAGLTYAVAGRGEGPEGDLLAWGCVDGVRIVAENLSDAIVVAEDLPQQVRGSYATTLSFSAGSTASLLGDEVVAVRDEMGSDATLILDAVEMGFRDAGDTVRADQVAEARMLSGLDALFEASLMSGEIGPVVALYGLEVLLRTQTEDLTVHGSLRVADELSFQVSHLSVGPLDDRMDLDGDVTGAIDTEVVGDLDPLGETLNLMRLSIALRASTLVRGIATASRTMPGEGSALSELLVQFAGCDSVPALTEIAISCDEACLANACNDVVKSITMGLELRLETLDLARGRVDLRGDVTLVDDTASLEVDRMEALLDGEWTGDVSPDPETLEVDLQAARVIPPG